METLFKQETRELFARIESDTERVRQIMAESASGPDDLFTELTTHLARAGGKQVRVGLMILSSELGNGPNESVFQVAAAIELTHVATLYHDDVIDNVDTRRGSPSANQLWGNKVAILAGDFLLAKASHIAARAAPGASELLAEAIAKVVEGQLVEMRSTYDASRTVEHYMRTISGKTAALMQVCARLGAILGDCDEKTIDAASTFGLKLGLGFQVADDCMDFSGSVAELGKQPWTDVRDGIYTLPMLLALEADSSVASQLGSGELNEAALRRALVETGAYRAGLAQARLFIDEAADALASVKEGRAKQTLIDLAKAVVDRVPELAP